MDQIIATFKDRGLEFIIAALAGYNVIYGLVNRETRFLAFGRLKYADHAALYIVAMIVYAAILAVFVWLIVNSFIVVRGPLGPQV